MRFLFFLILLAGIAGIVYPRLAGNLTDDPIGIWPVFRPDTGFQAVDVPLNPADAPVRVIVELGVATSIAPSKNKTVLTLTASTANRTALAETLTFTSSEPIAESPQKPALRYREAAGLIDPITGGSHRFIIGAGDADGVEIRSVDLILQANASKIDKRIQPIGFALTTIGFTGFVLAVFRRRRRVAKSGRDKSDQRWGRGAG